jgi:hypothetical protein
MWRGLLSIGVYLLASKFRIAVAQVCCAKERPIRFHLPSSDERRRQSGGIDRQTEQVRLIDRQITRLCAFEDFVDKARKAPNKFGYSAE